MLLKRLSFGIRSAKYRTSQYIRTIWYRVVRIPAGQLAWLLWDSSDLLSDKVLSRRNGIRVLGDLTLVEVRPGSIQDFVLDNDVERKFLIWSGDWDHRVRPIQEHYRYEPMVDLWRHRDQVEQSKSYRDMIHRIDNNQPLSRINKGILIDTPAKARKHLEKELEIFYSLETEGYNPELADDELNVAIARDGSMVKANGGRKRLIAAQILDLPSIPVRIAYIHKNWLARHQTGNLGRSEALKLAVSKAKALAADTNKA